MQNCRRLMCNFFDQPYLLTVQVAVKGAGGAHLTQGQLQELQKVSKLSKCAQNGNIITCMVSDGIGRRGSQQGLTANAVDGLTRLTAFLHENGYTPCCSVCGKEDMVSAFQVEGSCYHLCKDCETSMHQRYAGVKPKKENVIGGIVGALLGSLLGVLCICVVIMLFMTYLGDRLDWAILFYREGGGAESGYNVFECYRMVPLLISKGIIDMTEYIGNMMYIYAFLLLGAIPTIRKRVKEKQKEGVMIKLV